MEWVTSQPTVADHDRQGFSNVQKGLTGSKFFILTSFVHIIQECTFLNDSID